MRRRLVVCGTALRLDQMLVFLQFTLYSMAHLHPCSSVRLLNFTHNILLGAHISQSHAQWWMGGGSYAATYTHMGRLGGVDVLRRRG